MADDQERSFLAWFAQHGGWIDSSLSLQKIPGMGRGLVATRPIEENERLFTIPRSMLMNLDTSALQAQCEAAEEANPPQQGLAWSDLVARGWCPLILMLLWEHWRASTQSCEGGMEWGAYFGIMPATFSTPMFWSSDELKGLLGTDVEDKIGREDAEADYRECVLPYIRQYAHVFLGAEATNVEAGIATWYSVDMYHRMGSSILSRSFHVKRDLSEAEPDEADITSAPAEVAVVRAMPQEDEHENEESDNEVDIDIDDENESEEEGDDENVRDISMVPMADMLNAKFGSENTRCFYKREALEMRCTKPIAVGEQLLNTYGNPPNSDLLRRYGFVDEPNRGDLVEIPATMLVEAAAAKLMKATGADDASVMNVLTPRFEWACAELGVDEVFLLSRLSKPANEPPYGSTLALDPSKTLDSAQKRTLSRAASEIPDELIGFTRLLLLTGHGFERAQKKEALPNARLDAVEELDASWPGSPPVGAAIAVSSVLLDALTLRMNKYPMSWEDTAAALASSSLSSEDPRRMALVVRAGDQAILQEHAVVFDMVLAQARAEAAKSSSGSSSSMKKARK